MKFLRLDDDGNAIARGSASEIDVEAMKAIGLRLIPDDGRRLWSPPPPKFDKPKKTGLPDFETLTDALILFLDGDESGLKAIRARRKRALKKD